MVCVKLLLRIALWAHVIEIPDDKSTIVLSIGIFIGLKDTIPIGGHCMPISTAGDKLLWKNAQKNDEKNRTSDIINKIIPHFILFTTFFVCIPWNVDSRTTSRHHWIMVKIIIIMPIFINHIWLKWKYIIVPEVNDISPMDPVKGHGLLSTKWNGWFFILNFSWVKSWKCYEYIRLDKCYSKFK